MNRYLKLFLATGIPYGIAMGAFFSITKGSAVPGVMVGLFAGVLFGGLMALVLGFFHKWSVKRITADHSDSAMGVHHVRTLVLELSYERAFKRCIDSISAVRGCKVKSSDISKGEVSARTGMNWKTFGDEIEFNIERVINGKTRVKVSSRPIVRTTLVDYGKNLDNVQRVTDYLKQEIPDSSLK